MPIPDGPSSWASPGRTRSTFRSPFKSAVAKVRAVMPVLVLGPCRKAPLPLPAKLSWSHRSTNHIGDSIAVGISNSHPKEAQVRVVAPREKSGRARAGDIDACKARQKACGQNGGFSHSTSSHDTFRYPGSESCDECGRVERVCQAPYSPLNATPGSTRAARRAGSHTDSTVMTDSSTPAAASDNGSMGERGSSRLLINRAQASD